MWESRKIKSDTILSALDMSLSNSARSSSGGSWERREICFSAFIVVFMHFTIHGSVTLMMPNSRFKSKFKQPHRGASFSNCFAETCIPLRHIPRKIVGMKFFICFPLGTCEMTGP